MKRSMKIVDGARENRREGEGEEEERAEQT